MDSRNNSMKRFPLLDITHYVASLFVILIHCGRLAENDIIHYSLKVYVARMAVPIFLVTAGYFFHKKEQENTTYARMYFKKQWKTYLIWSAVYLPYGLLYIQNLGIKPKFYLAALPVGIGYLGFCYHLWYFPALFLGLLLVRKLLYNYRYPVVFGICTFLFLLGATETYTGYLHGTWIDDVYRLYQQFFITTRNGLFYTPIFLLIGFFLADLDTLDCPCLKKNTKVKLGIGLLFLGIESLIVSVNEGTDKNFLFSLIPVSFFLMFILLYSEKFQGQDFAYLRKTAQHLFFLHPIFLEGSKWVSNKINGQELEGFPLFFITLVLTTLASRVLVFFNRYIILRFVNKRSSTEIRLRLSRRKL
jgi:hypothetical protein